jgi:hypothetical protein
MFVNGWRPCFVGYLGLVSEVSWTRLAGGFAGCVERGVGRAVIRRRVRLPSHNTPYGGALRPLVEGGRHSGRAEAVRGANALGVTGTRAARRRTSFERWIDGPLAWRYAGGRTQRAVVTSVSVVRPDEFRGNADHVRQSRRQSRARNRRRVGHWPGLIPDPCAGGRDGRRDGPERRYRRRDRLADCRGRRQGPFHGP